MKLFNRATSVLEWAGMKFIILGYGVMIIVTLIEVLRRYFLGLSFGWSEELVRFLLVATTFVGGAIAYKKGSLVLFDVLLNKLSRKKSLILNVVNHTIALCFMVALTRLGLNYIMQPSILLQSSPGLQLSMAIPYAFIPLGCILIAIFAVEYILKGVMDIRAEGRLSK